MELTTWPEMRSFGPNANNIEGALRFLRVVEPSLAGIGRIVAAYGRVWHLLPRGPVGQPYAAYMDSLEYWAVFLFCQWMPTVPPSSNESLQAMLSDGPLDLGLHTWADPSFAARMILDFGGLNRSSDFASRLRAHQVRRTADALLNCTNWEMPTGPPPPWHDDDSESDSDGSEV